ELFAQWKDIDRETNPSEFAFAKFASAKHESFDAKWARSGRCWDVLGELLLQVRELAAEIFGEIPLARDAEVSINSPENWCDRRRKLKAPQTKQRADRC